jgi:serine/threonine protein kinase
MISFACPACGHSLQSEEERIGETGTCPACGASYQVPPGERPKPDNSTPTNGGGVPTVFYVPTAESPPATPNNSASPSVPVQIPGYEILGELGRGGMGVIYKARQLQPRRLVALKMILAGEHASSEALVRFRREAEAVARLAHPHIVPIHEVGEHHGRPYLVLEYVEGGSLSQKLADGPLPPRQAAVLLAQLADVVHFAHGKGVIHRDLKPANILLVPSEGADSLGIPKIADFGLAKQLEGVMSIAGAGPRTQSGAILGTPGYMAPEQAGGKRGPIGPAADVHALGAILYECLTGRPPFQAETTIDTILQALDAEPTPPRQLRADCPRDLETICLKCLEKDPHQRYATAGALADDLRRWRRDEPIAGQPPGSVDRLRRWLRRRRELTYLTIGILVTLGLAIGLLISAVTRFSHKGVEMPPPPEAEGGENLPAELPADLDLVPRDAFAFATVRVADLWSRRTIKELAGLTGPVYGVSSEEVERFAKELERASGISPGDIERATVVVVDSDLTTRAVVLALSKPCDPERIRGVAVKLSGQLQQKQIEGKTVYSPVDPSAFAFCPFSDRVILMSDPLSMQTLLEKNARRPPQGLLNEALELAARPHALVLGVRPSREFFETFEDLAEELSRNKLESLRGLDTASLAIDLPAARPEEPLDGLSLDLTLSFPDEAHARPGLTETLAFLRHMVGFLESEKAPAELRPLLASLLDSLRSANWRQEGSRIQLALQLHWKPGVLEDIQRIVHRKVRKRQPGEGAPP